MKGNRVFYGGAFDPMTRSHEDILKMLHGLFGGRLVVGVTNHDYKQSWKPIEWRKDVVERFCFEHFSYRCGQSAWEECDVDVVEQNDRTFKFLEAHPNLGIGTIVIGKDELDDLMAGKWHYSKELMDTYNFFIIPRKDGISSTMVRNLIKEGKTDKETLLQYISASTYSRLFKDVDELALAKYQKELASRFVDDGEPPVKVESRRKKSPRKPKESHGFPIVRKR